MLLKVTSLDWRERDIDQLPVCNSFLLDLKDVYFTNTIKLPKRNKNHLERDLTKFKGVERLLHCFQKYSLRSEGRCIDEKEGFWWIWCAYHGILFSPHLPADFAFTLGLWGGYWHSLPPLVKKVDLRDNFCTIMYIKTSHYTDKISLL